MSLWPLDRRQTALILRPSALRSSSRRHVAVETPLGKRFLFKFNINEEMLMLAAKARAVVGGSQTFFPPNGVFLLQLDANYTRAAARYEGNVVFKA